MNNNMNQPLTGGMDGGDSMSQTSQQSRSKLSGSLLDRIRAQRSREQPGGDMSAAAEQGQIIVGPDPSTPSQISIPSYRDHNNTPMNPVASTNGMSELGSSSMMSTVGFESGFPAPQGTSGMLGGAGGASESLLGDYQRQGGSQYSMAQYFQTFVMDVYSLFRSLPAWAQVVLVIFLIFLVIKLI